jgi:hypothetical protein
MIEPDSTVTISPPTGINFVPNPRRYYLGVTTITYTFTDSHGHSVSCPFTVTVLGKPVIECPPDTVVYASDTACTNSFDPGIPDLIEGVPPIDWYWEMTGATTGKDSTIGATPLPALPDSIGVTAFNLDTTYITWIAKNISGADTCTHMVIVKDTTPPTFEVIDRELCVEPLYLAYYNGNADSLVYDPDYPEADYYIFGIGNDTLDIDLNTYFDNCCLSGDADSIRWIIEFEGNDPTEPDIIGVGQPSTYKDSITGFPVDLLLWGDGVTFQEREHTITYWMTDCHGNESDPVIRNIVIKPRPQIIKMN